MKSSEEKAKAVIESWREARENLLRLKKSIRERDDADVKHWKKCLKEAVCQLGDAVIAGDVKLDAQDFEPLVKDLKSVFAFGTARTLIEKFENDLPNDRREWLRQQHALCTYKDEELIPAERFKRALEILDAPFKGAAPAAGPADRIVFESPETLALRGAVYKRMWEFGGQAENLYRAADCYLKAWERDPVQDKGYGGVNAAYLMDVLAGLEKPFSGRPAEAMRVTESWSVRARRLRQDMQKTLAGLDTPENRADFFFCVTMAEIRWGLEEWDPAGKWLDLAGRTQFSEWELQTTARQLVAVARQHGVPLLAESQPETEWHPAWRALKKLTAEDTSAVASNLRGKVGLALSGGGFRASLFHLGVLARLAEMDVLRSVEVLSTVSGGSIVGAHYYLWLREWLKKHTDAQLRAPDYVELVKRVQDTFLAGIRENLRNRGLSNLICNLKFLLPGSYTRSNRMGELYEDHIYARVEDQHPKGEPRQMRDLLIHPLAAGSGGTTYNDLDFNPKYSNWRRRAKVPILLLNTTSLNTGHNWHFTARWMGEPPGLLGPEAETIPRYRRLWYGEAPTKELQEYRLGYAVAASACVPALFEPLELRNLYPDRIVRLVDGGVHDNQGVAGLLDESCTLILCSDASGQMSDKMSPSNSILGVPLRSNSILMDRVRESQYLDLRTRVDSHALQGLFFVHLKQELSQDPITWIGGKLENAAGSHPPTSYGVERDVQAQLAAIRTDLDSFSEVEAFGLMASGYLMTKREFERLDQEHLKKGGTDTWGGFDVHAPSRGPGFWKFLEIAPLMALPANNLDPRREDLSRQLKAGSSRLFKAFKLCRGLSALGIAVLALIACGLGYLVYRNWNLPVSLGTVGGLMLAALLMVAGMLWSAVRIANPQAVMRSVVCKSAAAFVGFILTNIHLHLVDGRFLSRGKLERLMRLRR